MSAISSLSTTTLTDANEKENTNGDDTIHDEIDDIYKMVLIVYLVLWYCIYSNMSLAAKYCNLIKKQVLSFIRLVLGQIQVEMKTP